MDGLTYTCWPKPPLQRARTFSASQLEPSAASSSLMNLVAGVSPGEESAKSLARRGSLCMMSAQGRLIPIATSTDLRRNRLSTDPLRLSTDILVNHPLFRQDAHFLSLSPNAWDAVLIMMGPLAPSCI